MDEQEKKTGMIAVSAWSLGAFGCPCCGYRSGSVSVSFGGSSSWRCGECERGCIVLADGIAKSSIGLGAEGKETIYPELQPHPRHGIPKHGRPDQRPEEGEFFSSRGIGKDVCPCFVCGTKSRDAEGHPYLHNISGFVRCKEAGERVVKMFGFFVVLSGGIEYCARLDYRETEPDYVQVKVGACDEHLPLLEMLDALVSDGVVTIERIHQVRGYKK